MQDSNFWQQFASSFAQKNQYVVGKENMALFLARVTQERDLGNCLELACGGGSYSAVLQQHASSLQVTDISPQMLQACQCRLAAAENVAFAVADCFNLPFKAEQFDSVFMANLLHIIPNAYQVIEEVKRVLKPKGKIIILDVSEENMTWLQRLALRYRYVKTYRKSNKKGSYPFKKADMTNYLATNGFVISRSDFIGRTVSALYIVAEKQE